MPEKHAQLPHKPFADAEAGPQSQISLNLLHKKIGLKPLPSAAAEPPRLASRNLPGAPHPPSLPTLPKARDPAVALQPQPPAKDQEELGKRRAAEERWDQENREIDKKLSAVKSSGSLP